MSEHWTAEELREYQRTGREPVRRSSREIRNIVNAFKNPIPQEEIERRYAEAEARGEV